MNDFEGIYTSDTLKDTSCNEGLSESSKAYLQECVDNGLPDSLVNRIDEFSSDVPPKAIDSNPEISELIEPVKDQIDNKYLEAPSDFEQVEQISDAMCEIKGTYYDDWKILSMSERLAAMQEVENAAAEISHRPACEVRCEDLPPGHLGYFSPVTKEIVLSSEFLNDDYTSYKETLDTIIHEGRHAYQDYNLNERQVHSSQGDITNWKINENIYGYQSEQIFGYKLYWMQPVEADARKFAEDVLTKLNEKL